MSNSAQSGQPPNTAPALRKHKMSLLSVFLMIFCLVAGGYFGIEDMVSASGPGLTVLILLIFPLFWSLPQALIASELGSAIPDEGGYYVWVQRAFGEFWGFQTNWWRTISCYVDSALYVVLATGYIGIFVDLSGWSGFLLKAVLILIFTWINIRGIHEVGRITTILMLFVLATLVIFVLLGILNWQHNPFVPFAAEGQSIMQSLGFGFAIAIWIYSGYESMGTLAGELENPGIIPKATMLTVPTVILVYVLPIIFGMGAYGDYAAWSADSGVNFVTIVNSFGIPGLGLIFTLGAVACNLSLYNTYLASSSRGFYVLAEDKLFSKQLCKVNKKYGTPHIAIFSMAIVNLLLSQLGFATLVVIDVVLFMFSYLLWFYAIIALRIKEPDLERPFKIKLGIKGLVVINIIPTIICVTALFTNGISYIIGGCLGILTGPLFYVIFKKKYGGIDNSRVLKKSDKISVAVLCLVMAVCLGIGAGMFASGKSTADKGFERLYTETLSENYTSIGSRYVISEDSFRLLLEDEHNADAQTIIWCYQGEFSGDVYLGGEYGDEMEFAQAAFAVFEQLQNETISYMDIYSDDYAFYAEYGEAYESASDIWEYLTAAE